MKGSADPESASSQGMAAFFNQVEQTAWGAFCKFLAIPVFEAHQVMIASLNHNCGEKTRL